MNRSIYVGILALVTALALGKSEGAAEDLSARDIIGKMKDAQEAGQDSTRTLEMDLVDKRGAVSHRKLVVYRKKYGDEYKALAYFVEPAEVRGSGLLMWNHKAGEDDRWLYLSELDRVRRIRSSARGESFMGSDLSYEDLGAVDVDKRTHLLKGQETVDGERYYQVESTAKDGDDVYGKVVTCVSARTFLPVKAEFYDHDGILFKVGRFRDVDTIDGITLARRIEVENLKTEHRTALAFTEVKYNTGLADDLFTERHLKRGD